MSNQSGQYPPSQQYLFSKLDANNSNNICSPTTATKVNQTNVPINFVSSSSTLSLNTVDQCANATTLILNDYKYATDIEKRNKYKMAKDGKKKIATLETNIVPVTSNLHLFAHQYAEHRNNVTQGENLFETQKIKIESTSSTIQSTCGQSISSSCNNNYIHSNVSKEKQKSSCGDNSSRSEMIANLNQLTNTTSNTSLVNTHRHNELHYISQNESKLKSSQQANSQSDLTYSSSSQSQSQNVSHSSGFCGKANSTNCDRTSPPSSGSSYTSPQSDHNRSTSNDHRKIKHNTIDDTDVQLSGSNLSFSNCGSSQSNHQKMSSDDREEDFDFLSDLATKAKTSVSMESKNNNFEKSPKITNSATNCIDSDNNSDHQTNNATVVACSTPNTNTENSISKQTTSNAFSDDCNSNGSPLSSDNNKETVKKRNPAEERQKLRNYRIQHRLLQTRVLSRGSETTTCSTSMSTTTTTTTATQIASKSVTPTTAAVTSSTSTTLVTTRAGSLQPKVEIITSSTPDIANEPTLVPKKERTAVVTKTTQAEPGSKVAPTKKIPISPSSSSSSSSSTMQTKPQGSLLQTGQSGHFLNSSFIVPGAQTFSGFSSQHYPFSPTFMPTIFNNQFLNNVTASTNAKSSTAVNQNRFFHPTPSQSQLTIFTSPTLGSNPGTNALSPFSIPGVGSMAHQTLLSPTFSPSGSNSTTSLFVPKSLNFSPSLSFSSPTGSMTDQAAAAHSLMLGFANNNKSSSSSSISSSNTPPFILPRIVTTTNATNSSNISAAISSVLKSRPKDSTRSTMSNVKPQAVIKPALASSTLILPTTSSNSTANSQHSPLSIIHPQTLLLLQPQVNSPFGANKSTTIQPVSMSNSPNVVKNSTMVVSSTAKVISPKNAIQSATVQVPKLITAKQIPSTTSPLSPSSVRTSSLSNSLIFAPNSSHQHLPYTLFPQPSQALMQPISIQASPPPPPSSLLGAQLLLSVISPNNRSQLNNMAPHFNVANNVVISKPNVVNTTATITINTTTSGNTTNNSATSKANVTTVVTTSLSNKPSCTIPVTTINQLSKPVSVTVPILPKVTPTAQSAIQVSTTTTPTNITAHVPLVVTSTITSTNIVKPKQSVLPPPLQTKPTAVKSQTTTTATTKSNNTFMYSTIDPAFFTSTFLSPTFPKVKEMQVNRITTKPSTSNVPTTTQPINSTFALPKSSTEVVAIKSPPKCAFTQISPSGGVDEFESLVRSVNDTINSFNSSSEFYDVDDGKKVLESTATTTSNEAFNSKKMLSLMINTKEKSPKKVDVTGSGVNKSQSKNVKTKVVVCEEKKIGDTPKMEAHQERGKEVCSGIDTQVIAHKAKCAEIPIKKEKKPINTKSVSVSTETSTQPEVNKFELSVKAAKQDKLVEGKKKKKKKRKDKRKSKSSEDSKCKKSRKRTKSSVCTDPVLLSQIENLIDRIESVHISSSAPSYSTNLLPAIFRRLSFSKLMNKAKTSRASGQRKPSVNSKTQCLLPLKKRHHRDPEDPTNGIPSVEHSNKKGSHADGEEKTSADAKIKRVPRKKSSSTNTSSLPCVKSKGIQATVSNVPTADRNCLKMAATSVVGTPAGHKSQEDLGKLVEDGSEKGGGGRGQSVEMVAVVRADTSGVDGVGVHIASSAPKLKQCGGSNKTVSSKRPTNSGRSVTSAPVPTDQAVSLKSNHQLSASDQLNGGKLNGGSGNTRTKNKSTTATSSTVCIEVAPVNNHNKPKSKTSKVSHDLAPNQLSSVLLSSAVCRTSLDEELDADDEHDSDEEDLNEHNVTDVSFQSSTVAVNHCDSTLNEMKKVIKLRDSKKSISSTEDVQKQPKNKVEKTKKVDKQKPLVENGDSSNAITKSNFKKRSINEDVSTVIVPETSETKSTTKKKRKRPINKTGFDKPRKRCRTTASKDTQKKISKRTKPVNNVLFPSKNKTKCLKPNVNGYSSHSESDEQTKSKKTLSNKPKKSSQSKLISSKFDYVSSSTELDDDKLDSSKSKQSKLKRKKYKLSDYESDLINTSSLPSSGMSSEDDVKDDEDCNVENYPVYQVSKPSKNAAIKKYKVHKIVSNPFRGKFQGKKYYQSGLYSNESACKGENITDAVSNVPTKVIDAQTNGEQSVTKNLPILPFPSFCLSSESSTSSSASSQEDDEKELQLTKRKLPKRLKLNRTKSADTTVNANDPFNLYQPFKLNLDIWYLYKNNLKSSSNYRRVKQNSFVDMKPTATHCHQACNCTRSKNSTPACGSDCINRLMYQECNPKTCPAGDTCSNQRIQRYEWTPGLERFMTSKRGWGIRTTEKVKAGEFILEYTGEIVSDRLFEKRMNQRYRNDQHHYCLKIDSGMVIDGYRVADEGRFVNHSCEPNCEMQKWAVNEYYRIAMFAKRDIEPYEELFYDYNFQNFNLGSQQICHCGSSKCRGFIGGRSKTQKISSETGSALTTPEVDAELRNPFTNDLRFGPLKQYTILPPSDPLCRQFMFISNKNKKLKVPLSILKDFVNFKREELSINKVTNSDQSYTVVFYDPFIAKSIKPLGYKVKLTTLKFNCFIIRNFERTRRLYHAINSLLDSGKIKENAYLEHNENDITTLKSFSKQRLNNEVNGNSSDNDSTNSRVSGTSIRTRGVTRNDKDLNYKLTKQSQIMFDVCNHVSMFVKETILSLFLNGKKMSFSASLLKVSFFPPKKMMTPK